MVEFHTNMTHFPLSLIPLPLIVCRFLKNDKDVSENDLTTRKYVSITRTDLNAVSSSSIKCSTNIYSTYNSIKYST